MVFGGPLECRNSTAPPTLSFFSSAVSSLLMLITVPGNLLICLAVAKDPYKTLRSPFNLFLLNISAADLVVGLLVLPLSIAFHFLEGIGIMFAPLIKSLHLSFFISCSASVLGIAALSLDRYICVTSPMKYRLKLKSLQVKRASLIIWLISVVCPITYLYVDFIIYTFLFANGTLLFTLLVLAFVNHKIHRSLQIQRKQLQALADGKDFQTTVAKRDARVTKTFLFFLASFIVLTVPPLSFSYVLNFCSTCSCKTIHILRDLQFLSILFPSSVNPFIYAIRLPNFRRAIAVICSTISKYQFFSTNPGQQMCESISSEVLDRQFRTISKSSLEQPEPVGLFKADASGREKDAKIDGTKNAERWSSSDTVFYEDHFSENKLHSERYFYGRSQSPRQERISISQFYKVTTVVWDRIPDIKQTRRWW